ncbi:HEAT repeat domain-containing protein [Chloroflexus sp.]|uniref:HEAT repeat domain-containing protein n=1 Tax=Chloroflexus sp. TaxID=1904827 RepID=UPI002ACE8367|nr:HEAT repeat domain-containing protein [Chloroflexus sp.]
MHERSAESPELHFVPRALRELFLPRRLPRDVRAAIERWLASEPLAQMLPAAFALPFGLDVDPATILGAPSHLAIIGPLASGRSLVLAQIARRWLDDQPSVPLVRLSLTELDTPSLTPRAITVRALARLNLSPNPLEHNLPCLLLVDDWEDLPPARRGIWQRFLAQLSERWPQARVVMTLPPGELWPGFHHHAIAPLLADRLIAWIQHLFPHSTPSDILPLFDRDPLILLRERPAELILLALTQPLSGWPVSRAALYERAAAFVAPILTTIDEQASWRIGYTAYQRYRQAVALATQPAPDPLALHHAGPHWRALCVPIAFGAAPDPRPIITSLYETNLTTTERLLLLARALRERPRLDPALSRPLLDDICQHGGEALTTLAPALPVILIDICRTQPDQSSFLLEQIVNQLAPAASVSLLITLLDASDAPPALRWHAIDLLCRQRMLPPPLPTYADLISQAGRCLLAINQPSTIERLADPALYLGLRLLLSGAAGSERQHLIARQLLLHTGLPASLRALAPAALPLSELAQAAVDPVAEVRHAARAVWLRSGHLDQLARFVAQAHQPWQARDEALEDLAATPAGHTFLAGFALSSRLSLDLRLRAIGRLHRLPNGWELLTRLLHAEHEPAVVRAAAACKLAQHPQAAALLGPYLGRQYPPLVRRAVVQALGILAGSHHPTALAARSILLAAIGQPDLDAKLTTTIIAALSQHGGKQALTSLGNLLAPTYGVHLLETWITALPALIGPSDQWLAQAHEPNIRALLADLIVSTDTLASADEGPLDRPAALIARHVLWITSAAARALGQIGRNQPALTPAIGALANVALHDTSAPRPLAELLAADPSIDLVTIARIAQRDPPLRSAALQTIAERPDGTHSLLRLAEATDAELACAALDRLIPPFEPAITEKLLQLAGADNTEPVRLAALQALGRSTNPTITPALMAIVINEQEAPAIRAAALDAIAAAPIEQLIELIAAQPDPIRSAALRALSRSDRPVPVNLLHRLAFDADRACALAAVNALATHTEAATPILGRLMRSHPDLAVRLAAAAALSPNAASEAIPVFVEALLSPYPALQTQAFPLLAAADPLHPALRQPLTNPQASAVLKFLALQHLSAIAPTDPLIRSVAGDPTVAARLRCHAIAALEQQADQEVISFLFHLASADEPPPTVRYAAIMALDQHCAGLTNAAALQAVAALAASPIPEVALWAGTVMLDRLVLIEPSSL